MPLDVVNLDERIKDALLALIESVESEDEDMRLAQMRQFKRNNLFWHGFQYIFWSDVANDWRIPTHEEFEELSGREEVQYIFDFVVNVFKAHGESIIAALSADIPDVRFGPRDAQDPDDVRAVDAADRCVELIQKWNRAKLTIINALFYLATEGFVASYTYNKKDPGFGHVNIPQYGREMAQTTLDQYVCQTCGYMEEATEAENGPSEMAAPAAANPDGGAALQGVAPEMEGEAENVQPANELGKVCPTCGNQMTLEQGQQEEIPVLLGSKPIPKGREIIEIYGALSVRMPGEVSKQADAGYLVHYVDADVALFKDAFPDVKEDISADASSVYERSMRLSSLTTPGTSPEMKLTTQKRCWFRPWMINRLDKLDDDVESELRNMFKTGIYCSAIGQTICEVRDESMDRHWTITKAGPSKGIHADPLLQSLVSLQEIHNNLINLFVMQVEYGVPATYADTEVFDFQGQSKQEVSPGYVYPVTPRPGQSISEAFYTEKTTSLAKESTQLLGIIDTLEQFVTGSFPSIYGGPSVSGSKTLGEYDKSRSFALQRLSLVWYFINVWWGETIHKALTSFIDHQVEDEPMTSRTAHGFQTRWIRKADLKGSFDRLEPEVSSDFPSSFAQKRAMIMQLMQLGIDEVNAVLFHPDNATVVQSYVGLNELHIPLSGQHQKQMREIMQMIGFEPMEGGPEGMMSSVPIEPELDDDDAHIATLTEFLVGDIGQDLKKDNPASYANCLMHLVEHKQNQMMKMMGPPGAASGMGPVPPPGPMGPGGPGASAPPPKGKGGPLAPAPRLNGAPA